MPESVETEEPTLIQLEILLPQDPGSIQFPATPDEKIFEVRQSLAMFPNTEELTSYHLFHQSQKLDDGALLGDLADGDKLQLTLKDAPYNSKQAREHVMKVRDAAGLDKPFSYGGLHDFSGISAGATTYKALQLDEIKEQPEEAEENPEKTTDEKTEATEETQADSDKPKPIELTDEEKASIRSVLATYQTDPKLSAPPAPTKLPYALRELCISPWTPVSRSRKLQGDLFYLRAVTLEGETFHITAHSTGFFVNRSSATHFDGRLRQIASAGGKNAKISHSHSLFAMLASLSPKFSEQLTENRKALSEVSSELFNYPTIGFLANPWLVSKDDASFPDPAKTQEVYLRGGLDGSDLQKDWNDDFQGLKDLQAPSLEQRITREQLMNQTSFGFTVAAVRGALEVVRGNLEPLNPEDDALSFIYLRNGVFYSLAADSEGEFGTTGGNIASRAAATKDITAIKLLNRLNIEGVSHLLTTIVDYAGTRVVCQAPVPGVLSNKVESEEPHSIVVYGHSEDNSKLLSDEQTCTQFKPVAEALHLKPHKAWNEDGSSVVDVVTSYRTKGLDGTDGRKYIIDLYRTTPLDIEFIEKNCSGEDKYPYSEVTLRHEAVNEWWRREVAVAVKAETDRLAKEGKKPEDGDNKETLGIDTSSFSLNPDAFGLPKAPTEELAKQQEEDEQRVREVSKFVSEVLIPEVVDEFAQSQLYTPIDGNHLTAILHQSGINLRYLGLFAQTVEETKAKLVAEKQTEQTAVAEKNVVEQKLLDEEDAKALAKAEARAKVLQEARAKGEEPPAEEEDDETTEEREFTDKATPLDQLASVNALHPVVINEMVARATKQYLGCQSHGLAEELVPYVIAYVHNCILSSKPEKPVLDELLANIYQTDDIKILSETPASVRAAIARLVKVKFRYSLAEDWNTSLNSIAFVKRVAEQFGIQWKDRKYAFTEEEIAAQIAASTPSESTDNKGSKKSKKHSKKTKESTQDQTILLKTTFSPEDVLALTPIIKNAVFESSTIDQIWGAGKQQLASGETAAAINLLNEAIQCYERTYGPIHPYTARAYGELAEVCLKLNMTSQAVDFGRRSFRMMERTCGVASYRTLLSLVQLAGYESANKQYADSLKISKRIIDIWSLALTKNHPTVVATLSSVALLLQRIGLLDEANEIFTQTIQLSDTVNGTESNVSGLLRFQYAQNLMNAGKIPEAGKVFTEAFEIFKPSVGLGDVSTREARRWSIGVENYMKMNEQREKYIRDVEAQRAKQLRKLEAQKQAAEAAEKKKHKASSHLATVRKGTAPEIGKKSIDEIMNFINGGQSTKKQH